MTLELVQYRSDGEKVVGTHRIQVLLCLTKTSTKANSTKEATPGVVSSVQRTDTVTVS